MNDSVHTSLAAIAHFARCEAYRMAAAGSPGPPTLANPAMPPESIGVYHRTSATMCGCNSGDV